MKNSYKETWDDDIELNNIQKEIDDLISNNKELLLDIYKGNNSSVDLKPYLNEFFSLDYKHLCLALIFITHIKIKIERNYVLLYTLMVFRSIK